MWCLSEAINYRLQQIKFAASFDRVIIMENQGDIMYQGYLDSFSYVVVFFTNIEIIL